MESYTVPFCMLLVIIFLMIMRRLKKSSPRLPPSPYGLPIIGHLHLVFPILHQALYKLSTKYGPLMRINLGSVPFVVVSSAEMAKEVLKTHGACFLNRPKLAAIDYLTYGSSDFVFAPYGPYWKFMNKLCMSELVGGRTLERLQPIRQEERRNLVSRLMQKASARESVDLGHEIVKMTNNIITRMIAGQRFSDYEDNVGPIVRELLELAGSCNLADFIWICKYLDLQGIDKRLKDVRMRFDVMMENIIKRHKDERKEKKMADDASAESTKDILHMLLNIKEDPNSEVTLTMENIKAFVMNMFTGGTDTSALTIEWALAELIKNPSIKEKAQKEIHSVVGKGRLVEESDIPKLPYIQAIVKETLRLLSTGPLTLRESTEKCVLGGYEIPAKTRLIVNLWAIGRDTRYWEEPLEFRPERFMDQGIKKYDIRGQCFELLPFGSGRRMCPGISLAMQVVPTWFSALISKLEMEGKLIWMKAWELHLQELIL